MGKIGIRTLDLEVRTDGARPLAALFLALACASAGAQQPPERANIKPQPQGYSSRDVQLLYGSRSKSGKAYVGCRGTLSVRLRRMRPRG